MRSRWLLLALLVGVVGIVWGAVSWVEARRGRLELEAARREMASGRFQRARQRLTELAKRHSASSEIVYQLGLCEEGLGHTEAAEAQWSRIPPGSPFAHKASLGRARLLMNAGRFSAVEPMLLAIPRDAGADGRQAREALELLYHIEGRKTELRELILETWAGAEDPAGVLRRLYLVDHGAFPIDYVRGALESGDPQDDRVWLGKAHLAAWCGELEEAQRWLTACSRRQPFDQAVWRARVELARATGDLETVRQAGSHVPLVALEPSDIDELRAWLAARQGEVDLERVSLRALVAEEPGNIAAWDRLAELSVLAGHKAEAEASHKKKEEFNRLREEYKSLIGRDDRAGHSGELAILAEKLGRRIEARGWSLIAAGRGGKEPLVSADDRARLAARSGRMLGLVLADVLSNRNRPASPASTGHVRPAPEFVDAAQAAGFRFVHDNGHIRRNPPPPEAMCGGVGLLDYDGDGSLDLYVVQGGPFPPSASARNDGDRLYHNRGDGTFEDATGRAGISSFPGGYGHGVAVGDYDNDGRPDLFVTRWRSYALYHNRGEGRFEDVTEQAGLGGDRDWPTSAAFADLDNDGDLDLYVCHYLKYDPSNPRRCVHPESPSKHECNPLDFPSLPDHVFRNDGGRFVDVTATSGFVDPDGRGLGVVAAHLDDDNRIDLYVANDMTANYLFLNRGGFHFEERGESSGTAASADGGYKAGMGIACGDLDGDLHIDLAVTNYFGESTTFYRNLGAGCFVDHTAAIGMAGPTRRLLGFGLAFLDADNDGRLDVLSANGHVIDARPRFPLTMPLQLLQGGPAGRVADVSDRAGAPFGPLHLGRGLAVGDLDNDGRLDAVVLAQNEPLIFLHNQTKEPGRFITFALEGTRSNRDGAGARVTIDSGGRRQVSERCGGGSYQSASDPRLHFGLGLATAVDAVEVRWPSGQVDRHGPLQAGREYLLREGAGSPPVREHKRPPAPGRPPVESGP
jgi:thioredoxin-like negative regulator of GroEL